MELHNFLKASGINTTHKLLQWMSENIEYGYVDTWGTPQVEADDMHFYNHYALQIPTQLLQSRLGVCWDQTEFQRACFDVLGVPHTSYYIEASEERRASHSFCVILIDKQLFWFENSYGRYRGIHGPFNSLQSIFKQVILYLKMEDNCFEEQYEGYLLPLLRDVVSCEEYLAKAKSNPPIYTEFATKETGAPRHQNKKLNPQSFFPFFTESSLEEGLRQSPKSRSLLVLMSPDEFLSLASHCLDFEKQERVQSVLGRGERFHTLPTLLCKTLANGDLKVFDHNGRHRVRALKALGITEVPVILVSEEGGYPCYRWGDTFRRPSKIFSESSDFYVRWTL